jgi:chromosome segregation ATPase
MDQELVQYLDGRFQTLDARFDRIDQRFEQIDQRFDRIDQRLDAHDDRFDEVKRYTGILVEGLRYEIQLVAEGLSMHIQVQHVQEREYHDQQHRETRALMRSFYDELRQQQDQLKQRVENLERKQEN